MFATLLQALGLALVVLVVTLGSALAWGSTGFVLSAMLVVGIGCLIGGVALEGRH